MEIEGIIKGTSTKATIVVDSLGQLIANNNQARFQKAVLGGNVYSSGMTTTSISNVTFTTATTAETATPIIGVYNPLGSGKNLVILQVKLQHIITAATTTGGGGYVWMTSTNQNALTLGLAPLNRLTLATSGAVGRGLAGVALTGMVTTFPLVVREASGLLSAANFSQVGTAAGFAPSAAVAGVENVDGAIIVPPGGVLALMATTTPVAVSASSSIMWEEVAITS